MLLLRFFCGDFCFDFGDHSGKYFFACFTCLCINVKIKRKSAWKAEGAMSKMHCRLMIGAGIPLAKERT